MELGKPDLAPAPSTEAKETPDSGVQDKRGASWQSVVENRMTDDCCKHADGGKADMGDVGAITQAVGVGEESGGGDMEGDVKLILDQPIGGDITTMVVGEEGGGDDGGLGEVTTLAVGEEGGGDGDFGEISTMVVGEEGGGDAGGWSSKDDAEIAPPKEYAPVGIGELTTAAVGEEGGSGDAEGIKEALEDLRDGREEIVKIGDLVPEHDCGEGGDDKKIDWNEIGATTLALGEEGGGGSDDYMPNPVEAIAEKIEGHLTRDEILKPEDVFGDPVPKSDDGKPDWNEIGATTLALGEEGGDS